jgi:hypothetical protein
MGDFNSILSLEDKHNGAAVSTCETTDFRSCCSDHGLANLNYTGCQFTWSNGSVWSKLDRVLANSTWSLSHSQVHVHFGNPGAFSDHSPAIIRLESHHAKGKRCFKFFNMWAHFSHISERVTRAEIAFKAHQTALHSDKDNLQYQALDAQLHQKLLTLKSVK